MPSPFQATQVCLLTPMVDLFPQAIYIIVFPRQTPIRGGIRWDNWEQQSFKVAIGFPALRVRPLQDNNKEFLKQLLCFNLS